MSAALTVQPRHLALPECAMFAPTELAIPASISKEDFRQLGAALSKVDSASDLWSCDFALHAQRTWEDEGLDLAASATGLSKFFLKKCARIASVFPPARRYPQLKRDHYRILLPFDQAQLDAWLPTVVGEKYLSAKSLRALAVETFGEPVTAKQPRKRNVSIRCELYARLREHSPSQKVASFIEQVLSDYLAAAQSAGKASEGIVASDVPASDDAQPRPKQGRPVGYRKPARPFSEARAFARALSLSGVTDWWRWCQSGNRPADIPTHPQARYSEFVSWADWLGCPVRDRGRPRSGEKKAKAAKQKAEEPIREPASLDFQLAKFKREHPEWSEGDSLGVAGSNGKSKASVSAQPQKSTATDPRPKCKVKPVWTVCRVGHSSLAADKFYHVEDAAAAAMEYSSAKGYEVFFGECERCSAAQKRTTWHVFRERPEQC
jgi:hypothetical protein